MHVCVFHIVCWSPALLSKKTHARKTILYKICRKQKLLLARFFYRRAKVENNHRIENYSNFIDYHSMSGLWKGVWSCLFIPQMFVQNFQISVSGIKLKHNLNFRMNLKSPGTDYCLHQPFKLKNCCVSFLAKRLLSWRMCHIYRGQ